MSFKIEEGKTYLRKSEQGVITVRKVLRIEDKHVIYKPIYGAWARKNKAHECKCKKGQFFRNAWTEVDENSDFSMQEGCRIYKTFGVLSTSGELIVRCGEKKARLYLRKGYAKQINEDTLQFLDNTTEDMLRKVHDDLNNPFFTAEKNSHCVVCGKECRLSQHHVVPRRHVKKLPLDIRRRLANVLFICLECHRKYENYSNEEPCGNITDPVVFVRAWEKHFLDTMQPKHMTPGWKIFSVDPNKVIPEVYNPS